VSSSSRITPDDRVQELLIDLPIPAREFAPVLHVREAGKLCVVGSALPYSEGKLVHRGRVGLEVRLEQGQLAARVAVVQALGMLHAQFGTLNRVKQIVSLTGYISAGPEFRDHAKVLDQASQLLSDVFGGAGHHTRTPIGVSSLPGGACVMLEVIVTL